MIQAYLTAYYAEEWGNLIGQGLGCLRFFHDAGKNPSFQKIGRDLALSLDRGQSFQRRSGGILSRRITYMIEYGEIKSKLEMN